MHAWRALQTGFEPNVGQAPAEVRFVARGPGFSLLVTADRLVFSTGRAQAPLPPGLSAEGAVAPRVEDESITVALVGGASQPEVVGEEPLPTTVSYFLGNDPEKWRFRQPTFARVRLRSVYPGVDLVLAGPADTLGLTFEMAPSAEPSLIRLQLQPDMAIEALTTGDLVGRRGAAALRICQPLLDDATAAIRPRAYGRLVRRQGHDLGLDSVAGDPTQPRIATSQLTYSTLLGGHNQELVGGLAVDASHNVFLAGGTSSLDFPGVDLSRGGLGGTSDAFVAKLSSDGALVWASYLGGSGVDSAQGAQWTGNTVALDQYGGVNVVGWTGSTDFPVTAGAPQQQLRGAGDAFVVRLDPTGSALEFSTYLGGSDSDAAYAVVALGERVIAVAGGTDSPDFPTKNALQSSLAGLLDAFVTRLDTAGAQIEYATFFGGSNPDWLNGLAADSSGALYLTGRTWSGDFPVANAFQPERDHHEMGTCVGDAFISKISPDGSTLLYSTYLGGSGTDEGVGIAVDSQGSAYVTGSTSSVNFPLANAFKPDLSSCGDAFVSKLSADGRSLVYSTYLGGTSGDCVFGPSSTDCETTERGYSIGVDRAGRAHVAGRPGVGFPVVDPIQPQPTDESNGFLTVFSSDGLTLESSSLIGGSGGDTCQAVALDETGAVYVAGSTSSPDFPGASQGALTCDTTPCPTDAFVAKLSLDLPLVIAPAASPTSGPWPLQVHLFSNVSGGAPPYTYDWALGDGLHNHDADPAVTYYGAGTYHVTLTVTDSDGAVATGSLDITALPTCQLGCSAVAPERVLLGSPASFAAHTETTECTGPVSLLWDLGDGSPPSSEPSLMHTYAAGGTYTWHMTSTSDGKTCEVSRTITVDDISCSGPYDLFIPAAAHTPGVNGTAWQTDLDLLYLGLLEAHVDLALLKAWQANLTPQIASVIVPSGRALRLADVLGTLLPASNAALGVRFCGGTPLVNARFYTTTCRVGGTCGMYIPGVGADRAVTYSRHGVFHHLSYSPDPKTGFRVNIGFASAVGFAVQVVVRLYGDDGSLLGTLTRTLQPYEHLQLTRVHALAGTPAVASGWATVEVTTPDGEVHSYAMSIDNRSGAAIYMPPELVSQ